MKQQWMCVFNLYIYNIKKNLCICEKTWPNIADIQIPQRQKLQTAYTLSKYVHKYARIKSFQVALVNSTTNDIGFRIQTNTNNYANVIASLLLFSVHSNRHKEEVGMEKNCLLDGHSR